MKTETDQSEEGSSGSLGSCGISSAEVQHAGDISILMSNAEAVLSVDAQK